MAKYWEFADEWDRFWGSDFSATYGGHVEWLHVKDYGDVSININSSQSASIQVEDVSDVWIDTDVGGNWFKVVDAYNVRIQADQYGNSNNSFNVYDAWDVDIYATGGNNYLRIDDADSVYARFDWGGNTLDIDRVDDATVSLGGSGDNYVNIYDADTVDAAIWGGGNTVRIDMDQDFWDGDYSRENYVNLNFQGSRGGDNVEVRDADDVWIDTDGGGGSFLVSNSDDVRVQLDQYGNSDNFVRVYDSLDVSVYATGGGNTLYAGHNDNVDVTFDWGSNHVDIWYADDVTANLGGYGSNFFKVYDADSVNATIQDGFNTVRIDMNQNSLAGDDFSEESVRLNFNGAEGGNVISVTDADYTWIDIDAGENSLVLNDVDDFDLDIYGGGNTISVTDADNVHLDIDDKSRSGDNDITVNDADNVTVTTSEGANDFTFRNIDAVDVTTVGWRNDFDIDNADAVYIHNTWGGSRYQNIDVDHADDVTVTMANLYDSNIWINDADDVKIDGTAGSYNRGDNEIDLRNVDAVDVDLDGARNDIDIRGADNVHIDMDDGSAYGNHTVHVQDADDVAITTSEGGNNIRLDSVDAVDIMTVGWNNKIDIDWAGDLVTSGDVSIHNTWGSSRYQDIDIDHADDVNITMNHLNDSNIWVNDADDIVIDSYGASTGSNNVINLGVGGTSVEDVTVSLGGANNIVNVKSIVDVLSQSDIQIDMGSGGTTNIESQGGTADIDIRGSSNDKVTVAGLYASVYTYDGDDVVDIYSGGADVDTGAGDDTISAFTLGANIYAGSGNDTVWATSVAAHIDTGTGDDTVHALAAGSWVDTGAGNDTLYLGGLAAFVDAGDGNDDIYSLSVGGQGILAGDGDNTVVAVGGINEIMAGSGEDTVLAVGGLNVVTTNAGSDSVFAAGGLNSIATGEGSDFVMALGGANLAFAGSGNDHVYAGGFANLVAGDAGNDVVTAIGAKNILMGGVINSVDGLADEIEGIVDGTSKINVEALMFQENSGDDTLVGVGAMNKFWGADGNDTLIGVGIKNSMDAGSGDDLIFGAGGKNDLQGGSGDDILVGIGGLNKAWGGAGSDDIIVTGGANIVGGDMGGTVSAALGVIGSVTTFTSNMIHNFETMALYSSDEYAEQQAGYKDVDLMGGLDDVINDPYGGDDNIVALGAGNLILAGGGNDDIYASGAGNVVYAGDGADKIIVQGTGVNAVIAGTGNDTLIDLSSIGFMMGGEGDDTIIGFGRGLMSDFGSALEDTAIEFGEMVSDFFDGLSSALGDVVVGTHEFLGALGADAGDALVSAGTEIDSFFDSLSTDLNFAMQSFRDQSADENGLNDDNDWTNFLSYAGRYDDPTDEDLSAWNNSGQDVTTMWGGSGDDVIVSGFGVQTVSGGEGSDTYVVYEAEGIDFITESGGEFDVIDYRLDESDGALSMNLGDILFMADEEDLWITGGQFNTIVVDGMGDEDGSGTVEGFTVNLGDDSYTLDLEAIYKGLSDGEEISLADVLNVDQDTTFDELESLLKDEIEAGTGELNSAAVDSADLSTLAAAKLDDINIDVT